MSMLRVAGLISLAVAASPVAAALRASAKADVPPEAPH